MKKLMFLAVFLILAIGGVLLSYQNLKSDELQRGPDIKIPILYDEEPVASTVMTITKPYEVTSVKPIIGFYDITKENQDKSIIVINKTFIPNKGILYQDATAFDVFSIYDGTVIETGEDDLTGKFVKINHNNNMVATYRVLDDVDVTQGDYIKKGDKIGTSGTSEIEKGYLLLFELQIKDVNVNPEDYYNKSIKEI